MSARILGQRLMNLPVALCQNYLRTTAHLTSASSTTSDVEAVKNLEWNMKSFHDKHPGSEALLNAFKQLNLNLPRLVETIRGKPEIASFNPNSAVSNIEELLQLGFDGAGISKIISKYPYILEYEPQQIIDTFETWRSCHVHEKFLRDLFVQEPWLLSVSNMEVSKRVNRLHYLFNHKINRIVAVLLMNPTLLIHDWGKVEENFKFILKTMRILEKEISRSRALLLPLSHIKMRYFFLDKCGVYVRPRLKDDVGFSPHKNPPLSRIVDTEDDVFAVHVAMVSPDEYQVYKKLYSDEEDDVGMTDDSAFG